MEKRRPSCTRAFRTSGRFPARYSRRCYDLWCMDKTPVKAAAYGKLALLERVVRFKDRFYPEGLARYDLAKSGAMRPRPSCGSVCRSRKRAANT